MVGVLDTTLREGEQTPGVYFPPQVKLTLASLLDEVGVDIIEVGNPAADPEIAETVTEIASAGLKAKIGAHARCNIADVQKALDCNPGLLGVFLCVSEHRLQTDYQITLEQAVSRITETVAYARAQREDLLIRYTAEDATRSPWENVVTAAVAAVEAGASIISLADTTGYATPYDPERSLGGMVSKLRQELIRRGLSAQIACHCHNDRGMALANALDAYTGGADIIDATVLRVGERAGVVDLAELMFNLQETFDEGGHRRLELLNELYDLVSTHSGIPIPHNQPITGRYVFTHCAGVHIRAVSKDPALYQSLDPACFGRTWDFCLGVQSGRAAVELALCKIGREDLLANKEMIAALVDAVKSTAKRSGRIDIQRDFAALVEQCGGGSAAG